MKDFPNENNGGNDYGNSGNNGGQKDDFMD